MFDLPLGWNLFRSAATSKAARKSAQRRAGLLKRRSFFEPLEPRRVLANVQSLVADINTQPSTQSSSPGGFSASGRMVEVGSLLYFTATTAAGGQELWKSDGTAEGTTQVKDIHAGTGGSYPRYLTNVGGNLYFIAQDAASNNELWKSDGTAVGTVQVKDINSNIGGGNPKYLTNVGGIVFFSAQDATGGSELWKSDGTTAGTVRVKDISAGITSSNPSFLTNDGGTLYFSALTAAGGAELWKSDGTDTGTVQVKDIYAGTTSSSPRYLTNVGGTLYFRAQDAAGGSELWKSDGTDTGTVQVKDINDSTASSYPQSLMNVGGMLYFNAQDAAGGSELWKSDGTTAGTVQVKDIYAGVDGGNPFYLANVGGTLYFQARDAAGGSELWKSDGTDTGTVQVKDINAGTASSKPSFLTNVGGTLYFSAFTAAAGYELWKSDGTDTGTVQVKDLNAGSTSSGVAFLINVGGNLYFTAFTAAGGSELWKSDGTDIGTVQVKDIYAGTTSSKPSFLTNVGGMLYFRAQKAGGGYELWKSDGTDTGTMQIKDIYAGTTGSDPSALTNVGGTLYFSARDAAGGFELWKSDGTDTGTIQVKDINAGAASSYPRHLTNVGGTLYFSAYTNAGGYELWKSDGTTVGTMQVKDISAGTTHSNPRYLIDVGGTLYFAARDPAGEDELWKSDGTESGTVQVKDIYAGATSSSPRYLTNVGGTLFFRARDAAGGYELWKSDGTDTGTVQVKDIKAGIGHSYPQALTDVSGTLYFRTFENGVGHKLWRSDGTTAGTEPVKDIFANFFTNVGGTLYFRAGDEAGGSELWKSDGTTAGTVQVKDIHAGTASSYPSNLTNVGGTLFFQANDGVLGNVLWQSDGTAAGTLPVALAATAEQSVNPRFITAVGNQVFFVATTDLEGEELWRVTVVNTVGAVSILGSVEEDQTLTASIEDFDGSSGAISYQWQRDTGLGFVNIDGETNSSYTLTDADANATIQVLANYIDDQGFAESVTSNPTEAVQPINDVGAVFISGTVTEDETLTASVSDADGFGHVEYQWRRNSGLGFIDISGQFDSSYTLTDADVGATIQVMVRYTDHQGFSESPSSSATSTVIAVNDLGTVSISGTSAEDETLTASVNDDDGTSVIAYQWQRNTGAGFVNIVGANSSSYQPVDADAGATLRVTADYTDDQGTSESITSDATESVMAVDDAGAVNISGTAEENQTLTAIVSDADGITGVISYRWERNLGPGFLSIAGALGNTYVVTDADVGAVLRVITGYTDDQGFADSLTSSVTETVGAINDAGSVSISGTAKEDQTLTANVSDADGVPAAVAYQWQRDSGSGFVNISGATNKTYKLGDVDVGAVLRVRAIYTDDQGFSEFRFSGVRGAVVAVNDAGSVSISGIAKEDQTLTANVSDVDGVPATVAYQWQRDSGDGFVNIAAATSKTYKLGDADVGATLRVRATYTDKQGFDEIRFSGVKGAVVAVNDAGRVSISGTAKEDQTLRANVSDADGVPAAIAYQWQRNTSTGFVNIAGATDKTYNPGNADVGVTLRVRADYTDDQGFTESRTSAATATIANVNDAPVFNNGLNPTLATIIEDPASNPGTSINALIGGVTDADAGAVMGIALTFVSHTANGAWQLSLNNGGSWTALGAVSAAAARLLKSDGQTRLRFVPNADFHGTVRIEFFAWDRTQAPASGTANVSSPSSRGGSTPYSQALESATLTIISVVDPPKVSLSGTIGYTRGNAAIVMVSGATVTDSDSEHFNNGRLRVRITDGASASNLLAIGAGFSIDDDNNVKHGTTVIGQRTANGVGTNELIVFFNSDATPEVVQLLVRSLTFKTNGGVAGARKVIFTVSDGSGGVSNEAVKTVNVQ